MEIPSRFNSDFTSDPHSQHIEADLILWLPRDSGLTQSSMWDGFEAHVFALRTDFTPRLEYRRMSWKKKTAFPQWFLQQVQINSWSYFIAVYFIYFNVNKNTQHL